MTTYLIRRFLLIIPTFLGITIMIFIITRIVPGGPIEQMISQMTLQGGVGAGQNVTSNFSLSESQMNDLKEYYGLDKPIVVSYFLWLGKILRGDLGTSTRYNEPVWLLIKDKIPISLSYGLISFILTFMISIPLGIMKAIRHKSTFDFATSAILFFFYAIPYYIVGIGLLTLFAFKLEWFPEGLFISDNFDDLNFFQKIGDFIHHAILPISSMLLGAFTSQTFLMKNTMMDNLSSDYIRTAMAKGLTFKDAVYNHALRNSLVPFATTIGSVITLVISGSFLLEIIFNIDGMGLLQYESILQRDYPVFLGITAISSLLFLIGNIISDIAVAICDPRIRFGRK